MRKLVVGTFLTLDGVMQAPGGPDEDHEGGFRHGGWLVPYFDEKFGEIMTEWTKQAGAFLLGRKTYEMFADYWPNVTSGDDKPFADRINAITKIVFSRSLVRAPWGKYAEATIVKGQLSDEVARLKQQAGRNMVLWGSLSIAEALEDDGLIDEYQLIVCPMVLGGGRRMFREGTDGYELSLRETRSFNRGVVLLSYAPARAQSAV